MAGSHTHMERQAGYTVWLAGFLLVSLTIGAVAQAQNTTTSSTTRGVLQETQQTFEEAAKALGVTAFLNAVSAPLELNDWNYTNSQLSDALWNLPSQPSFLDVIHFFARTASEGVVVMAPSNDAMTLWDSDHNSLLYHICFVNWFDSNLGPVNTYECTPLLTQRVSQQGNLQGSSNHLSYLNITIRITSQAAIFTSPKTFHGTADSYGNSPAFGCMPFGALDAGLLCKIDRILQVPELPSDNDISSLPTVYNYLKHIRQDMSTLCEIIERNLHRPVKLSSTDGKLSDDDIKLNGLNKTLSEILMDSSFGTFFAPTDSAWSSYLQANNLDKDKFVTSELAANLVRALWTWTVNSVNDIQFITGIPGMEAKFVGSNPTESLYWGWYRPMMIDLNGTAPSNIAQILDDGKDQPAGKAFVQVIDTVIDAFNVKPPPGSSQR